MSDIGIHAVTGGLGFTGRHIAARLLAAGVPVRTLTNSPRRPDPFGGRMAVLPLAFDRPAALAESLRGVKVLYNTYWVRFNHRRFAHAEAVDNTLRLFEAARAAKVRKVVHVSITNPAADSPLEYFRGKALLEERLRRSGLAWTILRPAVLFGDEDVLINNIAWMLRRFPVFGVFGDGTYRLQPIYVDDLARLAVAAGADPGSRLVNAIGPETWRYRDLVAAIGAAIGKPRRIVSVPPGIGYWVGRAVGAAVGDVVVTRQEIEGLMAGLLHVDDRHAGTTRLSAWCRENADRLGTRWASELGRRSAT